VKTKARNKMQLQMMQLSEFDLN